MVVQKQVCKLQIKITTKLFIKFFYLPTEAQENCFKKNIKIYINPLALELDI